jgi:hypothetical protein
MVMQIVTSENVGINVNGEIGPLLLYPLGPKAM